MTTADAFSFRVDETPNIWIPLAMEKHQHIVLLVYCRGLMLMLQLMLKDVMTPTEPLEVD